MQVSVQDHAPAPFTPENNPVPIKYDAGGLNSRSGRFKWEKDISPCLDCDTGPSSLQPTAYTVCDIHPPLPPCAGSNTQRNRPDASSSKFSATHNPSSYFNIILYIGDELVSARVLWHSDMYCYVDSGLNTIGGCGLTWCCFVSLLKVSACLSKQSEVC